MMHPGQDTSLPRPIGNYQNITNYKVLDDNTTEHLHDSLTTAMYIGDTAVPGCLIKIGSCYSSRIWGRTNVLNRTYPHGLLW